MSEICYCVCAVALAVEWVACYTCADRQGSDWLGVLKCVTQLVWVYEVTNHRALHGRHTPEPTRLYLI